VLKTMKKLGIIIGLILLASVIFAQTKKKVNVDKVLDIAQQHYRNMLAVNTDPNLIPRSTEPNGTLKLVKSPDWCSGFVAGMLWYLYDFSKKEEWKTHAHKWTMALANEQFNKKTHDLGFMLWCSFGNGYRLTKDTSYIAILINGANSLSSRFNPNAGVIRSWDFGKWMYPVIIDNMMNLEFLIEVSQISSNTRYRDLAIQHTNNDMKHHFRSDFSVHHVVDYDTLTGIPRGKQTWQGAHDSSAWSRGQAWALYGFTTMYRYTKNPIYLKQAEGIAQFILKHPNLPKDKVPYWDFNAPNIPNEERDASAAAVIASSLLELSKYSKKNTHWFYSKAEQILMSLSSDAYLAKPNTNNNFILMHSVGAKNPNLKFEVDSPLNYADYYFVEALMRYKNYGSLKALKP
jgi:unsaturated chondroitin disaccharide hydrolase